LKIISPIKCLYSLVRFVIFPLFFSLLLLAMFFIFTALAWAGGALASASMKVQNVTGKGISGLRNSKELAGKAYINTIRRMKTLPNLVLVVNTGDRVELQPTSERGNFSEKDLERASFILKDPRSKTRHSISPRLLNILYRIQTRFKASEIRIISGYRSSRNGKLEGNHGKGRAVDFIVPGTNNGLVAKFARVLGFVGVGIYPTSGFVHVDVRDRSYFWVDMSGPGQPNQERAILLNEARKNDIEAEKNGETAIEPDMWINTSKEISIDSYKKGKVK
jgi:uncharacterized protein YcbK (DUF882 family)